MPFSERLGAAPAPLGSLTGAAAVAHSPLVGACHGWRDAVLRRRLVLADALGLTLALTAAAPFAAPHTHFATFVLVGLLTLPVWIVLFKLYGLYDRDLKRISHSSLDDVPWLFHALVIGTLALWGYYRLLPIPQLEFAEIVMFASMSLSGIPMLRSAARTFTANRLGPERVLLVGAGNSSPLLVRKMLAHPIYNLKPVGVVSDADSPTGLGVPLVDALKGVDLERIVRGLEVNRVVVSQVELDEAAMVDLIQCCRQLAIKVSVLPQLFDTMGPSLAVDDVGGMTVLGINPPVLPRSSRLAKRSLDLAIAALLLLPAALLCALIAIAIKLDSPGPVLFRQQRIGKHGRRFWLVKFRTMGLDAEQRTQELLDHSEDPHWLKLDHDPRITRVGRVLRLSSLDELPQLWNVFKGEMSLVGPRPLIESEDQAVGGWDRTRLDLTPGVTGLWQVLGRVNIPFEEMVKLDYVYVTNWSLWGDVRLLLRTFPAVIGRRGAN